MTQIPEPTLVAMSTSQSGAQGPSALMWPGVSCRELLTLGLRVSGASQCGFTVPTPINLWVPPPSRMAGARQAPSAAV